MSGINGINPNIPLDELPAPSDTTTLNATVSAHGLLPKLSGDADEFLDGTGAWSAGGVGGTTGSTDNAVLRADGTGGSTIQTSGVTISDAGVVSAKGTAASVAAYASDNTKNVAISHDGTHSCVTSSAGSVKLVPQAGAYGTILSDSILRVPSTFQVQTTGGGVMCDVSQAGLFRLIDSTVGGSKYFGLAPLAGYGAQVNNGIVDTFAPLKTSTHTVYASDNTKNVAISHDGTNGIITVSSGKIKEVLPSARYLEIDDHWFGSGVRINAVDPASPGNTALYLGNDYNGSHLSIKCSGSNVLVGTENNTNLYSLEGGWRGASTTKLCWTSTSSGADAADVAIGRNAAGVLETNNGTAGQFAALKTSTHTVYASDNTKNVAISHNGTDALLTPSSGSVSTANLIVTNAIIANQVFGTAGPLYYGLTTSKFAGTSNYLIGFTSSTTSAATLDTAIGRNAAGVLEANTGTLGTLATLTALIRPAPYTFATVPSAASNTGSTIRITDRAQRQAYSDGTDWRFVADDVIIS